MTKHAEAETSVPHEAVVIEMGGGIAAYKAEQETQNTIARAHPRNPRAALENALMELDIAPEYACKSFYVIPFKDRSGGEEKIVNVEGPSIKAAITLARTWGNNASGWRVKDQTTERVEVEGVYVDHETNVRTVRTKTASRFFTKRGTREKVPLSEEALVKAIAAAGSKAVRDAILAGQPFWYTDSYYRKAREIAAKTIGGKSHTAKPKTYQEKLAWVKNQLANKGVTDAQFDKWVASFDPKHGEDDRIADIVGVYNAIADGQTTVEKVFGGEKAAQEGKPPMPTGEKHEKEAVIKVHGVADSEFNGEPATCIRDTSEPAVKYFTTDAHVIAAAKEAKKSGKEIVLLWIAKAAGDNVFRWATGAKA